MNTNEFNSVFFLLISKITKKSKKVSKEQKKWRAHSCMCFNAFYFQNKGLKKIPPYFVE